MIMVLITSACGEDSDKPACTHDLARAFTSHINKVCKLKKKPEQLFRYLVSLDTPEWAIIRDFFSDMRYNLMFVCPFLMIQILNPCPAEHLLVIYYYCIRLKNHTSFAIQTKFEESAAPPPPPPQKKKTFITYPSQEMKCSRSPAATRGKRLPDMLKYKVGHPCRLRFSWLHE